MLSKNNNIHADTACFEDLYITVDSNNDRPKKYELPEGDKLIISLTAEERSAG
jgi:hypothetical protein